MCHQLTDQPFRQPITGAPFNEASLVLTSTDGTRFNAFVARPASPTGVGMLVLPDFNGLNDFYRELAREFAAEGIDALTVDYYGRTAGVGPRPPGFDVVDHMDLTQPETVDADVSAAAQYLKSTPAGRVKKIFAVGFCFGGAAAWRQTARGLDGAIGFYGSGQALRTTVPDLKALKGPLLLLVAEADDVFPLEDSKLIDRQLEAAGVSHRTIIYAGAPHGFFTSSEWAEACSDSWGQVLAFVRHYAARRAPTST